MEHQVRFDFYIWGEVGHTTEPDLVTAKCARAHGYRWGARYTAPPFLLFVKREGMLSMAGVGQIMGAQSIIMGVIAGMWLYV